MRFPIAIVDFEASSLDIDSYPIEAGLALCHAADQPISVWSSLIVPTDDWNAVGWDVAAQRVHGIARSELDAGMSPVEVASHLNQCLGPLGHAWSDGGRYDGHWMAALFRAAKIKPAFHLWDIAGLFAFDRAAKNRFADVLRQSEPAHRAGDDAARICSAIARASAT